MIEIVDEYDGILTKEYPKWFERRRQETKLYKTPNSEVLPICVSARTKTSATSQKSSVGVFPGSAARSRTTQRCVYLFILIQCVCPSPADAFVARAWGACETCLEKSKSVGAFGLMMSRARRREYQWLLAFRSTSLLVISGHHHNMSFPFLSSLLYDAETWELSI